MSLINIASTAASGLGGTLKGAATSAKSLVANSDISGRKFARDNRDYMARREDSAYQRKVADLKAAGLNPILAAQGPGAAANASTGSPTDNTGAALGAANSAVQLASGSPAGIFSALQAMANIRQTEASTARTVAEIPYVKGQVGLQPLTAEEIKARTHSSRQSGNLSGASARNVAVQYPAFHAEAIHRALLAEKKVLPENLTTEASPISPILKDLQYLSTRWGNNLNQIGTSAKSFRDKANAKLNPTAKKIFLPDPKRKMKRR